MLIHESMNVLKSTEKERKTTVDVCSGIEKIDRKTMSGAVPRYLLVDSGLLDPTEQMFSRCSLMG